MSKFCADCGTAIEAGEKFCSGCGKTLAVTPPTAPVCPKCGTAVEAGERFCAACGAKPEARTPSQTAPAELPVTVTKAVSTVKYWRWLFVMTLPLAGLVVSILWSRNKEPSERRSLAKAMIFYGAVWLVVCIAFAVTLNLFLQAKDLVNIDFRLFGIKLF